MTVSACKKLLLSASLALVLTQGVHAATDLKTETDRLRAIEQQLNQTKSRTTALTREREALSAELADVSDRLVALAGNIQSREQRIEEIEERLTVLALKKNTLQSRLRARRGALAELLAGLQRLERNPPPPLAVDPKDASKAVRGALLFGTIVPDLKGQAVQLTRQLAELDAVRTRIITARAELDTNVSKLAPARAELQELLARKQALLKKTTRELKAEQERATALAEKAKDIRELLAKLAEERRKAEIKEAEQKARALAERKAAEEKARLAAEAREKAKREAELAKAEKDRAEAIARAVAQAEAEKKARELAAQKQRELAALQRQKEVERERAKTRSKQGPVKFAKSIGKLAYPAKGEAVRRFNDKDGFGGRSEGLHIATRKNAQVTSPIDGKVEFAGEFRSYGKLIIINTEDGYHLLLAGLDKISVSAGQSLIAGEPVGAMGTRTARATLISDRIDDPRPILYVEVRKGSKAVDSSRWWSAQPQKSTSRLNNGGNQG